ncbi:hypothetical protein, partial [Rhizobium sp. NZLR5]|uniref:hypothetical protein n=1 Tax=Rhizobium sp. NZLR5 TaxID=2731103 RepID=UPI001C839EE5
VARQAHNLKAAGSNPAPATNPSMIKHTIPKNPPHGGLLRLRGGREDPVGDQDPSVRTAEAWEFATVLHGNASPRTIDILPSRQTAEEVREQPERIRESSKLLHS